MTWNVRDVPYTDPDAQSLIAELNADMTVRYGGPDATPVAPAEFAPPRGAFVVVTDENGLIGCGGLRDHGDGDVELKRMYVRAARRREGHAARLLTYLEQRSCDAGFKRVVLETGDPQYEAIAFYERCGYVVIPGFGYYRDEPSCRCYGKRLD